MARVPSWLRAGAWLGLLPGLLACDPWSETPPRDFSAAASPNVVVIVADDLGLGHVSAYPQRTRIPTPNIDRIASEGIRFSDGYASSPVCWLSRAALLTGRHHQRFENVEQIPKRHAMISGRMAEAGYATAAIGKWHQGMDAENRPEAWGFDEFFGFLGGLHDYHSSKWSQSEFETRWARARMGQKIPVLRYSPIYDGQTVVTDFGYLTDEFSARAVDFVDRHAGSPFFLYLAYNAIHHPLQTADGRDEDDEAGPEYTADVVRSMIDSLDRGVGRVLAALDAHGLRENTLVVFTSDNGSRNFDAIEGNNGPYRGGKRTFAEGGIRVPFLIRWPAGLPAGVVYEEPVSSVDLLPTIVSAAGLDAGGESDGVDLLPHLRGQRPGPPHPYLYWGHPLHESAAVRHGSLKWVRDSKARFEGLYDLASDPGETTDLRDARPAELEDLRARYEAWRRSVLETRAEEAAGWTTPDQSRIRIEPEPVRSRNVGPPPLTRAVTAAGDRP